MMRIIARVTFALILSLLCGLAFAVTPTNSSATLVIDAATSSSTTNVGYTFTAGRTGIAVISHFNGNALRITSVTIGGSSATRRAQAATGNFSVEIWDAQSMTGGTSNLVINYPVGDNYVSAGVLEFASGDVVGYDAGTGNNATGTSTAPVVSTAATTSQASTLSVAGAATLANSTNVGLAGPSSWTAIFAEQDSSVHQAGRGAYFEESTAGTKTATFSQSGNETWLAAIASYALGDGEEPASGLLLRRRRN